MTPNDQPGNPSVLARWFGHNLWANLKLLDFCAGLSDAQLDASAVGGFGSIRDTLVHLVDAEVDYARLALGLPEAAITQFPGCEALKAAVRWAGDEWLKLAVTAEADSLVRVSRPQEPVYKFPLTGLMVQFINHSTEHRAQIAAILTQLGLEPPNMSGWRYMREMGELLEFASEAEAGAS